ncbi:hypothetical protein [Azospirillum picis]|uniref:Antitoxin ParD1/3/4 n=1 Tax=Azospirillum picis TaxID=488438 RepID=A0ABU0MP53_9PROT|nr:hypothetical protein [Azospirillum picis]MBP2301832.1 antitoxin ParD1/3/4 [Azospirillum picis]MDQ0534993.1 antitoxin ParD1/3/4 [Azospirillum picis]
MDLPQEIERMAARRAAEGGYRDAADYVAHLVAADIRDASDGALEGALLEGLDGDGEEWSLDAMRAGCNASLKAAKGT